MYSIRVNPEYLEYESDGAHARLPLAKKTGDEASAGRGLCHVRGRWGHRRQPVTADGHRSQRKVLLARAAAAELDTSYHVPPER